MSLKLLNEKGQSVLIDLLIGITIFMLVLAAGLTILNNQINAVTEQEELLQQQKAADTTLSQLVSSTGMTTTGGINWETLIDSTCSNIDSANIKFFGLALTDRMILPAKINSFKTCAANKYDETKAKLLISYDFYFRLADPETGAPMKGCPDDTSSGKCEAGITGEGKKIDTVTASKRVVAFYNGVEWVSAIAEINIFKTR